MKKNLLPKLATATNAKIAAVVLSVVTLFVLAACNTEEDPVAPVDPNHIGTFNGIEIRFASGVDRRHGEHALDRIRAFDRSGDFPNGGR